MVNTSAPTALKFCRFLAVDDVVLCLAPAVGTYRPTEFQMEHFCTSSRMERCPVSGMAEYRKSADRVPAVASPSAKL